MRDEGRTDEESAGESPFLGAADDGEREPMRGDEGMQKRHRCDSADCGQIFGAETCHFNPQIQNPKPTNKQDYSIHLWIQIQLDTTTLRYPSHFR